MTLSDILKQTLNEAPHVELKKEINNLKFADLGLETIHANSKIEKEIKILGILYRFIYKKHTLLTHPHNYEFKIHFDDLMPEDQQYIINYYNMTKERLEKEDINVSKIIKEADAIKRNHIYISNKESFNKKKYKNFSKDYKPTTLQYNTI